MRSLLLVAAIVVSGLVAGVAATSGDARSSTPGDGCLVVSQGFGKITVTLTRGVIFGRFQSGSLSYNDQGGTPSLPRVWQVIPVKLGDHVWKYGPADNLRFRATGPTRLTVNATFIDLSVAGRGSAVLSAANFDQTIAGSFSVDAASFCGDNFQQMPLTPARFSISSPVAG